MASPFSVMDSLPAETFPGLPFTSPAGMLGLGMQSMIAPASPTEAPASPALALAVEANLGFSDDETLAMLFDNQDVQIELRTGGEPQASKPPAGEPQSSSELQAGEPQAGERQAGEPQAGRPQAGEPQADMPHADEHQTLLSEIVRKADNQSAGEHSVWPIGGQQHSAGWHHLPPPPPRPPLPPAATPDASPNASLADAAANEESWAANDGSLMELDAEGLQAVPHIDGDDVHSESGESTATTETVAATDSSSPFMVRPEALIKTGPMASSGTDRVAYMQFMRECQTE